MSLDDVTTFCMADVKTIHDDTTLGIEEWYNQTKSSNNEYKRQVQKTK